ncbi:MAG: peptidylprolyl isomerase [Parcubacteria group bacterium]
MKNIILSVCVVGVVLVGAYIVFTYGKTKEVSSSDAKITTDMYSTTTSQTDTNKNVTEQSITNTNENKKSYMITIETNYGPITFETYNEDAPNTVNNFVTLANKGYYNGLTFHRVIKGFMIQGGDPNGNGTGGPGYQFEDELNPNTASYKAGYQRGVVAMANAGPNTNGSQFFIMHADNSLPNAYTIFGKVVSGLDVVDKIANVQTGPGDKPISLVKMTNVIVK